MFFIFIADGEPGSASKSKTNGKNDGKTPGKGAEVDLDEEFGAAGDVRLPIT